MPPIEWPTIAPTRDLGLLDQGVERGERILRRTRRRSAAAPRAGSRRCRGRRRSGSGTRPRGGRRAIGSVRSRADSQPWTRTTAGPGSPPRAGMNQAGRSSAVGLDGHRLVRQAEIGGRDPGRVATRIPGPHPVGQREAVGEAERGGGERRPRSRRGGGFPLPVGDGNGRSLSSGRRGRPMRRRRARRVSPAAARLVHSGRWPSAIPVPSSASSRDATPDRDQGCLASPGAAEPSRPDRRRSGRVARRDAADGRDQRRLRGADARDRPGRAAADVDRMRTARRSSPVSRAGAAARPPRSRRGR